MSPTLTLSFPRMLSASKSNTGKRIGGLIERSSLELVCCGKFGAASVETGQNLTSRPSQATSGLSRTQTLANANGMSVEGQSRPSDPALIPINVRPCSNIDQECCGAANAAKVDFRAVRGNRVVHATTLIEPCRTRNSYLLDMQFVSVWSKNGTGAAMI